MAKFRKLKANKDNLWLTKTETAWKVHLLVHFDTENLNMVILVLKFP